MACGRRLDQAPRTAESPAEMYVRRGRTEPRTTADHPQYHGRIVAAHAVPMVACGCPAPMTSSSRYWLPNGAPGFRSILALHLSWLACSYFVKDSLPTEIYTITIHGGLPI